MKRMDRIGDEVTTSEGALNTEALLPLVRGRAVEPGGNDPAGVTVGRLLALRDGVTPLVALSGAESVAVEARATVDLNNAHVGGQVVLVFDTGDRAKPIVVGVVRNSLHAERASVSGEVEVDADGRRLVVSAQEQLVLRCGKASITLTKAGKVIISGAYVSSRSSTVNRIIGGSVQIN